MSVGQLSVVSFGGRLWVAVVTSTWRKLWDIRSNRFIRHLSICQPVTRSASIVTGHCDSQKPLNSIHLYQKRTKGKILQNPLCPLLWMIFLNYSNNRFDVFYHPTGITRMPTNCKTAGSKPPELQVHPRVKQWNFSSGHELEFHSCHSPIERWNFNPQSLQEISAGTFI